MKNKFYRLISLVLVISILMSLFGVVSVYASAETKIGYVTADSGLYVRKTPTSKINNKLTYNGDTVLLYVGQQVTIIKTVDSDNDTDNPTWHHIKFKYNNVELEGYVTTKYVRIADSSGNVELLDDVPEVYKEYIKDLVAAHPNWTFRFYDTGIEWSSLVSNDAQGDKMKSMIYKTFPLSYRSTESGCYNWSTDSWIMTDSGGWYHANDKTIQYYMDPRNFFNESNIFMFEALSYDEETHTIEGVQRIIKGSFMDGKTITDMNGNKVTYAQAYMDAAKISGVSPFHLASRTIQEVGVDGSGSVSGTYSGYKGYYNFYNIMAASGSDPIASGLRYASGKDASNAEKEKYMLPWNSPYKAIVGGAKWIGNGYINNNQDTLYYQKYNVVNKNWNHQYMANITAPVTESVHIKKTYNEMGIMDNSFTFIIPYYRNMPTKACELPVASNASPNNWLKSLTVEGYDLDFSGSKTSGYSISVENSVSYVNISAKAVSTKATVKNTGKISLKEGINHIKVVVTAENGDERTYTIEVIRGKANKVPLKSITLDKTELTLNKGESYNLTVTYNPENTTDDKTVVWTTSNKNVVTVKNGKITAIGEGEATITAKVGSLTATCKVVVTETVIPGDVSGDGYVSAIDARIALQAAAGKVTLTAQQFKVADTNTDGEITAIDARNILKLASQS